MWQRFRKQAQLSRNPIPFIMTSFQRLVPVISLRGTSAIPPTHLRGLTPCSNSYCARSSRFTDFNARRDEITRQLVEAAETAGFLTLVDHGISVQEIEAQFAISKTFFDLSPERKGKTPHSTQDNDGWEYKAQLRPSTGTYDQKESLWLQRNSQWPSEEDVPGFRETTEAFMDKCAEISNQVCKSPFLGVAHSTRTNLWPCTIAELIACMVYAGKWQSHAWLSPLAFQKTSSSRPTTRRNQTV